MAPRSVGPGIGVSEDGGVRYLHFDSPWVQGAMRLRRPFALELEYQRQMMAPLLFVPRPRRIVQLGLGAGALTKFCWRHLPQARVTVVERWPSVVAVARRWFRLPPDDARLAVVEADAREFVFEPAYRGRADWLQIDLYDAAARGPVYDDPGFYRACRNVLRPHGVAVVNLFGSALGSSLRALAAGFPHGTLPLPETRSGNRVVLAFADSEAATRTADLQAAAAGVRARFGLDAAQWLSASPAPRPGGRPRRLRR